MARLARKWEELNRARFDASMAILTRYIHRAARDRESVDEANWQGKVAAAITGRSKGDRAARKAMGALATRLAKSTTKSTDELIQLHSLSGRAAHKVLERVSDDYAHRRKLRKALVPPSATLLGRRGWARRGPGGRRANTGRRDDHRRGPRRAWRDGHCEGFQPSPGRRQVERAVVCRAARAANCHCTPSLSGRCPFWSRSGRMGRRRTSRLLAVCSLRSRRGAKR